MQVQKVNKNGTTHWVLLDDEMHLVDPVCDFLDFQRKIDRADNTLRAYALDLKIYWEFLEKRCLRFDDTSVSIDTMADFVDDLRRNARAGAALHTSGSRTNRSINRILSSVHSFYRYERLHGCCQDPSFYDTVTDAEQLYQGYLIHTHAKNHTKKSMIKLKESNAQARIVTEAQMREFTAALPGQRDRLLFGVLYYTGARIQEALDLEVQMLPAPDREHTVGAIRQIRSKGKRRDLYAPMFLIRELNEFVHRQGDPGVNRRYLFVVEKSNYAGRQLTYHAAYDMMRRTQRRTGTEFNFHDLRHTFCTRLIEQGVDTAIVQQVMGHEHLYTTRRYVHLSEQYVVDQLTDYWEQWRGGMIHEIDESCE